MEPRYWGLFGGPEGPFGVCLGLLGFGESPVEGAAIYPMMVGGLLLAKAMPATVVEDITLNWDFLEIGGPVSTS